METLAGPRPAAAPRERQGGGAVAAQMVCYAAQARGERVAGRSACRQPPVLCSAPRRPQKTGAPGPPPQRRRRFDRRSHAPGMPTFRPRRPRSALIRAPIRRSPIRRALRRAHPPRSHPPRCFPPAAVPTRPATPLRGPTGPRGRPSRTITLVRTGVRVDRHLPAAPRDALQSDPSPVPERPVTPPRRRSGRRCRGARRSPSSPGPRFAQRSWTHRRGCPRRLLEPRAATSMLPSVVFFPALVTML